MIEMQVFCDPDRDGIRAPWSADGQTYASDGHICIRLPAQENIGARADAPNVASFFSDPAPGLQPLPVVDLPKPRVTRCEECEGRGTEHDCPECGCKCDACDGYGHITQRVVVRFGKLLISGRDWRKLVYLPNTRVAAEPDRHGRLRFAFDGGDGVAMPMRGRDDDDLVIDVLQNEAA